MSSNVLSFFEMVKTQVAKVTSSAAFAKLKELQDTYPRIAFFVYGGAVMWLITAIF